MRFHAARGAMSVGQSQGGLPPDSVVEREDAILAETQRLIRRWHDPAATPCGASWWRRARRSPSAAS
jgi:hypothetical protein